MSGDKEVDFLNETCERDGVAVSTTKDGVFFMFKRSKLKQIVEQYPDKETLCIFVQHRTFKN